MRSGYLVAAALALWALLSWSVALAKIEHFKDEQGTLHITNSGEAEQSKGKTGLNLPTPQVEPPQAFPEGEVVIEPPPEPEPPPELPPEAEAPPIEEAPPPSE